MKNSLYFVLCLALLLNTGASTAGDIVPVSFTGSNSRDFSIPAFGNMAVAWHPSGRFLALSGQSETRVYAAPEPGSRDTSLAEVVRCQHGTQSVSVVFSTSGNVLTTIDADGTARFWYLKRAFEAFDRRGDSGGRAILNNPNDLSESPNESFSWNHNSKYFVYGGEQGGVRFVRWGNPTWIFSVLPQTHVHCLRFIRGQENGRSNLLAISAGNSVKIWRGEPEPDHLQSYLARESPARRTHTSNADLLGALTHVRYVEWDGRRVRELVAPGTMEFSRDGNALAVAFGDVVKLWNPFTGTMAVTASHGSEVRCIDWSADGSSLVTVTTDGKIRQWDSRGNALPGLDIQGNAYYARFSPDGKQLLIGLTDAFCLLSVTGDDP